MAKKKHPLSKLTWKPPVGRREELARRIAESGLNTNAFLTERVFGKRRSSYPPHAKEAAARMLYWLSPVADWLRKAEAEENAASDTAPAPDELRDLLMEIRDLLLQIRAALFTILGRKP